ncbi:sodium/iodide cotransporter-like [Dermacentor andersoni]|uniref:sodium/iodide cotransporter-like n=1 Tax=Dermacentor andersoni TaxID=34620 RepID=UPI003B3A53F5
MEDIILEYVVFGVLMALNFGLGLYFSLRRKARLARTTVEVFLGSRALRALPLAASVVATIVSSAGMVGMTGHFYAYGFHLMWHALGAVAVAPVAAHVFLPVMYGMRITSVFER